MKGKHVEDEQVMREVQSGNVGRLELLFDRHHRALYRYFLHLTSDRTASEDLVQDVFFRILKYRQSYQPETSFRAWMYQIGRNVYIDQAGKRKNEVSLPDDSGDFSSREMPPDRQYQNKEEAALLHRALAALPREKREVLVMSRFLELRYEEIASVLKCEVGTVKVRVYRALRELGDRFFALGGERAS
jgi:RNA polymerase sigma-70 factor (ECF subfamily)